MRDGMKLHRRKMRLDGRDVTVIGLRPGTTARFSTCYSSHGYGYQTESWHVQSDHHGARLIGRLLWGLAFQARPGTLLLIDRPFLVPNPFDAAPSDLIVLVPGWCTTFTSRSATDLKRQVPLRNRPTGTVRWKTHGLDQITSSDDLRFWSDTDYVAYKQAWMRGPESGRVEQLGGAIAVVPGSPAEAMVWAVQAARASRQCRCGWDYTDFAGDDRQMNIFRDFRQMMSIAKSARSDVVRRPNAPQDPDTLRHAISTQAGIIADRFRHRVGAAPLGNTSCEYMDFWIRRTTQSARLQIVPGRDQEGSFCTARIQREARNQVSKILGSLLLGLGLERVSVDGSTAVIRGTRATYRVNLTDGRIIIEPTGRQLDIAPTVSQLLYFWKILRPFHVISDLLGLVLAKVLLLSRDDLITDVATVEQIQALARCELDDSRGHRAATEIATLDSDTDRRLAARMRLVAMYR